MTFMVSLRRSALCAVVLLMLAGCALPVTQLPDADNSSLHAETRHQLGDILDKSLKDQNRLWSVGGPILFANASLCPRKGRSVGLFFGSTLDLPFALREVARERANLGDESTVLAVIPGTDAAAKGILPGDILTTLNGKKIGNSGLYRAHLRKIDKAATSARFGFMRNGVAYEREIQFAPICNYPFRYISGAAQGIEAYTNGRKIFVSQGLMDFVSDDELGVIIAHELAHDVMHHIEKGEQNAAIISFFGAFGDLITGGESATEFLAARFTDIWSPRFEKEADYVGLYLLARAGGNIEAAAPFWRRFAANLGIGEVIKNPFLVQTHPPSPARFALLERAEKEIRNKVRRGDELMPNTDSPYIYGARYAWWSDEQEEDNPPNDDTMNR